MKKQIFFFLGVVSLVMAACTSGDTVTLSRETLNDKIRGGWAGQAIGCTYGGPTEFRYRGEVIHDSIDIPWPEGYLKTTYVNNPNLYDDLYMDLTFLDVFNRLGLDAPLDSFTQAFAYYQRCWGKHFSHARTTLWSFISDYNNITCLNFESS